MARTLIKQVAIGSNSDYYLRLYYEETNVDTVNNRSDVTISLYGYTTRTAYWSWNGYGNNSFTVVVDGTTSTLSNQNVDTETWQTEHYLHSYSKTISHNADGSKSITVSGSMTYQGGGTSLVAGTYSTGNVTQNLTTIARASTVGTVSNTTITSSSGNVTINISKKNSAYYDRIVTTGAISKTINIGTAPSGTISWSDLLAAMPSTDSATLNITVKTYSNSGYSTLIGSNTGKATITINKNNVKPSISFGAISVNASGLSGKLVAGVSTAKAKWTVSNATGASVSKVVVTGSNCSVASGASSTSTSGTPVTAQLPSRTSDYTITLTATVTDSRGATASATTSGATVYGYAPPNLTFNAYRVASSSATAADPTGAYVYTTFSASVGASVGGSNTVSISSKTPNSITDGGHYALATNATQAFTVVAKDTVGNTTSKTINIGTALIPFDLYSNAAGTSVGVGVGTTAVPGQFTSDLPAIFNKSIGDPYTATIGKNTSSGNIGWYEVKSGTLTGYQDLGMIILFSRPFYDNSAGIYFMSIRCDNSTSLTIHKNGWLVRNGIDAGYVKLRTSGNNWYLYVYQDSNYGPHYVRILGMTYTATRPPNADDIFLQNNDTVLTSDPGGTAATDIGIVGSANSASDSNAVKLTGNQKISGEKWFASPTWVGAGNETGELQLGVRTGGGNIYMYSNSNYRGIYVPAHGSASARSLVSVGNNDNIVYVNNKIPLYRGDVGSALLSSSVGTTAVTLTNAYNYFTGIVVRGMPGSIAYSTCFIPKVALTTSDVVYQVTDEGSYITFNVRYSGANIIINVRSSTTSGKTLQVYGIN